MVPTDFKLVSMIQLWINRLMWTLALWVLQVFVLNHIHIYGCITPMVAVYLITLFPKNTSRNLLLVWAFCFGLALDVFAATPGVASASLTATAFLQPWLLNRITTKDAPEDLVAGRRTLGSWRYFQYLSLVTFFHHCLFFTLEAFSFFHYRDLLLSILGSWLLSMPFLWAFEYMRRAKKKEEFNK